MQHFFRPRIGRKSIENYRPFASESTKGGIREISEDLKGIKVVHLNTSASSGGVAEILKSQVPLERSLGIDSDWLVMKGSESFFEITKEMHNLLQGKKGSLSTTDKAHYLYQSHLVVDELQKEMKGNERTVLVIHDPQPLPLIVHMAHPTIVRLHADLSTPHKETLEFLRPFFSHARLTIVSDESYRPHWIPESLSRVSYPAIDPLNAKNILHSRAWSERMLTKIGLDVSRPIMTQISRFDPWKDPAGVIEAYKKARIEIKGLQLVLGGLIVAEDDPEAIRLFAEIENIGKGDPDIHLFAAKKPPAGLSNDEFINALQSGSTVLIQKSTREGFGMTVTESMWKKAAVVAGNAVGLRIQIENNENGFIVSSIDECAKRVIELVQDEKLRTKIGAAAHASVAKNFLMPRLVLDHLEAYRAVLPRASRSFGTRSRTFPHVIPTVSTH